MNRILLISLFIVANQQLLLGQVGEMSHNYIMETVVRESGVTTQSQLNALPVSGANRSIQYFDGLGRPMQAVQWQGSPDKKDIVQHIEYDGFGRESRKYLPYVSGGTADGSHKVGGSSNVIDFYGSPSITDIVRTPYPYAETVFENSPLNRVQQQGAPGAAWQPEDPLIANSGHTVKTAYGTNISDDVLLWQVNETNDGASAKIGAEDNYYLPGKLYKTTIKDENWTSGKAGTVEEYKDFDDRVVLKRVWKNETEALNTYYVYDDVGDLRYVIPPGYTTGIVDTSTVSFKEFVYAYNYDGRHRLIEKKIPGRGWEWIVYNANDQPVLTQDSIQRVKNEWSYTKYDAFGRVTETGIHSQTYVDRQAAQSALDTYWTVNAAYWEQRTDSIYSNQTFPNTDLQPLVVNYYDDYGFEGSYQLLHKDIAKSNKTRTLLTGTLVSKDDGTSPLLTVSYYDDKGRVIQTVSQNHLGGTDYVTNTYNFVGELMTSKRVHKAYGDSTLIITKNDYDHVGRLLAVRHRINDQDTVTLLKNEYNEIGQLKTKSVGGDALGSGFHSSTSYAYNERGWTVNMASPYFSYMLKYNDGAVPQYNGNISEQHWGHGATTSSTYSYSYDKLNRLTNGTSTGTAMSEAMSYDDMGNITTLTRDGGTPIAYSYAGNRLTALSGGLSGTYSYDANGNALTDRTGMAFGYNHLNLPDTIWNSTVNVGYLYDAMGTKLRKYSNQGGDRDYVGGIEYGSTGIELIHTGEGVAYRNISDNTYTYRYNLTDHLGNIRATLYRNPSTQTVEILQADDYYPFGKQYVVSAGDNKYLYNGKELQGELGGQYDYGARFYDAEIGRFNVIDRFAEKYYSMTPYQYGGLDPIKHIDVNGDSIWITSSQPIQQGNNISRNNTIHIAGKVLKAGTSYTSPSELARGLNARLNSQKGSFSAPNGLGGISTDNYTISAQFVGVDNMSQVEDTDHLVVMVDRVLGKGDPELGSGDANGLAEIGGFVSYVEMASYKDMVETAFHEVGHNMGLGHPDKNSTSDPMSYTGKGANFSGLQMREITGFKHNTGRNHMYINNRELINRNISTNQTPYRGLRVYEMKVPKPISNPYK